MDGRSVPSQQLYQRVNSTSAPLLVDVRRNDGFGAGLLAISHGLSANFPDDHEMLKHGMVIYDALYTWRRRQSGGASAR